MKKRLAIAAAILLCAVGAAIALGLLLSSGAREVAGWKVVAGKVDEERGADGSPRARAAGEASLERGGAAIRLDPGTSVSFPPTADLSGVPAVPSVIEGRLVLKASTPFVLGGETAAPSEPIELALDPGGITVIKGTIAIGGRLISAGERIILAGGGEAGDAPPVDGEETRPEPEETPPPAEAIVARTVDARTGLPLGGVEVFATWSHSEDGYPPLPVEGSQVSSRTDPAGILRLPPFLPEDPRAKLHLQASLPGFVAEVAVLRGERDADGARPPVTLALRRALTCRVVFLDPEGSPLAGAAIEVRDAPPDPYDPEDALVDGRAAGRSASPVRYTDADGGLIVRQDVTVFTLHHPLLHLLDIAPGRGCPTPNERSQLYPSPNCCLDLLPREGRPLPDPAASIETGQGEPLEYRLVDRDKVPVPDALIEIRLGGEPSVRLHTGSEGEFVIAPRPFATPWESDRPISIENPHRGTMVVLSPLLWKAEVPVAFPSRLRLIAAEGRQGSMLRMRVLEDPPEADDPPPPISADGIRIDAPMTLVRRTAGGEADWEGPLPPAGSRIEVALRGHIPALVEVPPHVAGAPFLDVGGVVLDPGWTFPLRLVGDPGAPGDLRFSIADRERPEREQEYRVPPGKEAAIGGIEPDRKYFWAVDGSRVRRVEGEVFASKGLVEKGLEISLEPSDDVEVAVAGRVEGLRPEETNAFRVIERFVFGDSDEPRPFASYPLAPDGLLGSRRILPLPRRAEVMVAGPGDRAGFAARDFPPGRTEIDFGWIDLRDFPRGEFVFRAEGLGAVPVAPPRDLALIAEEGRTHELARLIPGYLDLAIEHLLPGGYLLRWGGEGPEAEVHRFVVGPWDQRVGGAILRKALEKEFVGLRLVDPEGKPVPAARIEPEREDAPPPYPLGGGTWLVEVLTRSENRIRIEAPGLLPAELLLPAGAAVPDPIPLRRGVRAKARVLDIDGRPFDGRLEVSFAAEGEDGAAPGEAVIVHGGPFETGVARGTMDDSRFPPGLWRIAFRAAASEARVERVFEIAERANDLGRISLGETRTISGTVVLPDGEPAPGAVVSVRKPGTAMRFPGRDPDPKSVLYSAKAGPLGRFRIDGLPVDLGEDVALAAHLAGWTDAVEEPADLEAPEHPMVLAQPTRLAIDAGYADKDGFDSFEFLLRYAPSAGAEAIDLGPVAPGPRGGTLHEGVTPGIYGLLWSLRESHPAFAPRKAEVTVAPGLPASLSLRIPEKAIEGEATLNGRPLAIGWVILVPDPENPAENLVGRVRDGRFTVPAPARGDVPYATLIPERDPLPWPRFERGEALPAQIPDFNGALRRRFLPVHHTAHDFVLEVSPRFLEMNPEAEIEFPHWDAGPDGFRKTTRKETLKATSFRLDLLPPGRFSLRVTGRTGSRLRTEIEMDQDRRIVLPD
jgi:hypothetical protein